MEALKLTEAAESFWEELMERDTKLLHSVDECAWWRRPIFTGIEFQRSISAAGPLLVALTGYSWFSRKIAMHLKCTHARYDDVRPSAPNMDDLFLQQDVLWEISSSQLSLGHSVVAHCPRLSRQQVDRLLELADSRGALLIIIQSGRSQSDPHPSVTESGHMPEIGPPGDMRDVPVLIINTLDRVLRESGVSPAYKMDDIVLEFIFLCMDIRVRCEREVADQSLESGKSQLRHFSHPHLLTLQECISEIEADCWVCSASILGLCYSCLSCKFFVHRSCAQLPQYVETSFHAHPLRLLVLSNESDKSFTLSEFPEKIDPFRRSSLTRSISSSDNGSSSGKIDPFRRASFTRGLSSSDIGYSAEDSGYSPESRAKSLLSCIICDGAGERPFYRCWQCYDYFVHYECAMSATGDIDHSCHVHPLKLQTFIYSRSQYVFTCYACGGKGSAVSYSCAECRFYFHLKCVLKLPLSFQHKRHHHPLVLSSPPKDGTNEYYCELCETRRHPDYWIYYCRPCEYEAHLSCANPDIPPYSMPEDGKVLQQCLLEISLDFPPVLQWRDTSISRGNSRSRSRSRSWSPVSASRSSSQDEHQVVRVPDAASTDTEEGKCEKVQRKSGHDRVLEEELPKETDDISSRSPEVRSCRSRSRSLSPIAATRSSSQDGHQEVRDREAASADAEDGEREKVQRKCDHDHVLGEELPRESDEASSRSPQVRSCRRRSRSLSPISATGSSSQDDDTASSDAEDGKCEKVRRGCAHQRVLGNQYQENLTALIIAVKGHPCAGRRTVAQLLAKALKCTLIAYDRVHECISTAQKGLPQPQCPSPEPFSELSYQVLWRVIKTQLERNHHVVIDLPSSRRVHFNKLLHLATSAGATVILIECAPRHHIESQRWLEKRQVAGGDDGASSSHKPSSGKYVEVLSEQLEYEDYDVSGVQVAKLTIDTASVNGLEGHIESAKKLVLSSLYDQYELERVLEDLDISSSRCVHCRGAFIRRKSASFPTCFKHEADQHELQLETSERIFAYGKVCQFTCNACAMNGLNVYYYCNTCDLRFHPKCLLELPLMVRHERDEHALALTPSVKDDTCQYYCDVCEERRGADDWIYYCKSCDYQAHVACVIDPQFFQDNWQLRLVPIVYDF